MVEGHGRVRGTELVGVVVWWRWRRQRRLRTISPVYDPHGRGHGRVDELVGGRALAEESLHSPSPALVHHNHLDYLLALDECVWAKVSGRNRAEQGGWRGQGQRRRLNTGLAQLIGLQPVVN